jgi:signal peptidase I
LYVGYGWLERTFVYERGILPQEILGAMDATAPQAVIGWPNLILPFDTATYHLRTPERGAVVGFVPPGQEVHKPWARGYRARVMARVVGLAGERIEVQRGQVRLNGQLLHEPYLQGLGPAAIDLASTTVPHGHVFLLGDNRAFAVEVYRGGIVPYTAIRGRLTEVGRLKWRVVVHTWLW